MRRAERAGRESASAWIKASKITPAKIDCELTRIAQGESPAAYAVASIGAMHIGAHQLSGRALKAALEAYDRGYRARLGEELAKVGGAP